MRLISKSAVKNSFEGKTEMDYGEWKHDLRSRLTEYLTRERPEWARFGGAHTLDTHNALAAFALGAASVFTKFIGRPITPENLELILPLWHYAGGGHLVLEGLRDWNFLDAQELPDGSTGYPLIARITISESFQQTHNHSIVCPGCDHCPNFFGSTSRSYGATVQ